MPDSPLAVQRVLIQRLDADMFRPFGAVISEQALAFPEYDPGEGRIAFEKFTMKRSKLNREVMGFHFSYTQPVIVLGGKLALMVAPPPADATVTLETPKSTTTRWRLSKFTAARASSSDAASGMIS